MRVGPHPHAPRSAAPRRGATLRRLARATGVFQMRVGPYPTRVLSIGPRRTLQRLRPMLLQPPDDIVEGESGGIGVSEHPHDERAQALVVLARGMGTGRRAADERSDAAARFDHSR